jgi:transposase-like protein
MKQLQQDKMYGIIQEWQTQKLTKAEICQRHNISKSQFFYWLCKFRKTHNREEKFIPLEITAPVNLAQTIRILYPNQVTVIIENAGDVSMIKQLINII